jgi:hypothetical protein
MVQVVEFNNPSRHYPIINRLSDYNFSSVIGEWVKSNSDKFMYLLQVLRKVCNVEYSNSYNIPSISTGHIKEYEYFYPLSLYTGNIASAILLFYLTHSNNNSDTKYVICFKQDSEWNDEILSIFKGWAKNFINITVKVLID